MLPDNSALATWAKGRQNLLNFLSNEYATMSKATIKDATEGLIDGISGIP
jgi:hypothetical protein